jgi:hypothetical protein
MDEFSLSRLADIRLPPPPPLWPPAPAVWLLLVVVLALAGIAVFQWLAWRRRHVYRRAGITLLSTAASVREVSVVLKRVALAAYPRERVASLVGAEWVEFLRGSGAAGGIDVLAAAAPDEAAGAELKRSARAWIKTHRVGGGG